MKHIRWMFPTALVAAAIFVPAGPSAADEDAFGNRCPDGYMPMPAFLMANEDRNGNNVICIKPSNGQIHDDPNGKPYACNGIPTPPPQCEQPGVNEVFIGDDIV